MKNWLTPSDHDLDDKADGCARGMAYTAIRGQRLLSQLQKTCAQVGQKPGQLRSAEHQDRRCPVPHWQAQSLNAVELATVNW
ncbi:hypothetical protein DKK75_00575 [Bifidobacterium asteroides]|uniref:Transposase n=1 Tax=Bifidobacterium asteroides TaxID=1684 RepID=A0A318MDZ7_9BIFI|nr:hypothetical protein DKK75_00575 [Bifidobacterium asteroides]